MACVGVVYKRGATVRLIQHNRKLEKLVATLTADAQHGALGFDSVSVAEIGGSAVEVIADVLCAHATGQNDGNVTEQHVEDPCDASGAWVLPTEETSLN